MTIKTIKGRREGGTYVYPRGVGREAVTEVTKEERRMLNKKDLKLLADFGLSPKDLKAMSDKELAEEARRFLRRKFVSDETGRESEILTRMRKAVEKGTDVEFLAGRAVETYAGSIEMTLKSLRDRLLGRKQSVDLGEIGEEVEKRFRDIFTAGNND